MKLNNLFSEGDKRFRELERAAAAGDVGGIWDAPRGSNELLDILRDFKYATEFMGRNGRWNSMSKIARWFMSNGQLEELGLFGFEIVKDHLPDEVYRVLTSSNSRDEALGVLNYDTWRPIFAKYAGLQIGVAPRQGDPGYQAFRRKQREGVKFSEFVENLIALRYGHPYGTSQYAFARREPVNNKFVRDLLFRMNILLGKGNNMKGDEFVNALAERFVTS